MAIEYVKDYCIQNGLSLERLKTQRFELSYNECGFFQPSNIPALGLVNDYETMPKATLIIRNENGRLIIIETEYTKQYLSNEVEWILNDWLKVMKELSKNKYSTQDLICPICGKKSIKYIYVGDVTTHIGGVRTALYN